MINQESQFVVNLMRELASEMKRPYSSFEPFTQELINNWLDSKEALLEADESMINQLKMPVVLKRKLNQKLNALRGNGNQPPVAQQQTGNHGHGGYPQHPPQNYQPQKLHQVKKSGDPALKTKLEGLLNELYQGIMGQDNLLATLKIIDKLIGNVIKNPGDLRFRVIKLDNKKIKQMITNHKPAVEFLNYLKFLPSGANQLKLEGDSPDITELKFALDIIHKFGERTFKAQSNIGKSHVGSRYGKTNLDIARANASDIGQTMDHLKRLKWQRDKMIPPTCDRKFRIISREEEIKEKMMIAERFTDHVTPDVEIGGKYLLNDVAKKKALLTFLSEPKFSNKRKEELSRLINSPIFTETKIRFILPNGTIFQGNFSPKERAQDLREAITPYIQLEKEWYLYTTPPVQKIELKKLAHKNLDQFGFVPRAKIYIGIVE